MEEETPLEDAHKNPETENNNEKGDGEEATENKQVKDDQTEHTEGETVEIDEEHTDGEQHVGEEHVEGEFAESEKVDGEELVGEGELLGEHEQVQEEEVETKKEEVVEVVEEEEVYVEEPPPDPAAPYNFTDSSEALKLPFELRPDQLAEVEQLWEYFQDYTPAYTDINEYITETELVYMLKSLLLMTYTPEQMQELIEFCVRPPHPQGHITFDQFLKMVTIRQRDFPIEEEIRSSLQVLDADRTGSVDRDAFKDMLYNKGHKLPQKQLDNLIKEVDIANDGTIGVEDVVGTMCIDLNPDDIQLLRSTLYPDENLNTAENEEEM